MPPNVAYFAVVTRPVATWITLVVALSGVGAAVVGAPVVRLGRQTAAVVAVDVSPDGATVATVSADGNVRLWDARDGGLRATLNSDAARPTAVAFPPDNATVAVGCAGGLVVLFESATARVARQFQTPLPDLSAVAFAPVGRTLAARGTGGELCLWDLRRGELLQRLSPAAAGFALERPPVPLTPRLAFSPDGALLASAPQVWDLHSGREIARLTEDGAAARGAFFSPDGATLVTGITGQRITLWETATWRVRKRIDCRGAAEYPCAFSPDGRRLWSASGIDLYEWDLATGRRLRQLSGEHRGRITAVAVVAATGGLLSASEDGTAVIWPNAASPRGTVTSKTAPADFRPEGFWGALAAEDAAAAYDAMWAFVAVPERAVPYLRNRFPRQDAADADRVRQLISQLNHEQFTERERAMKELGDLDDAAEPFLKERLAAIDSPEVAQRLEVLLQSIRQSIRGGEVLRAVRALEVLERIGTPDARAAIKELASGAAGAKLKARAQAALRRLDARR